MLAACRSDFYLMKSTIRAYLIAQLFMVALAIATNSQYLYLFYPTFTSVVLTMNGSSYNSSSGFSSLLLSSPISRANVVVGRYLFLLLFCIPTIILSCFIMFILGDATAYEMIRLMLICCTIILTLMSIFTPITYILKPNYISVAFLCICFIPSIIVILLKPVIKRSNFDIQYMISTIENIYNSLPTLTIILFISLVLLAISITVSIAVFRRKEF